MTGNKWALAAVAGTITMTLIGGVAIAGFQPFAGADQSGQGVVAGPAADLQGHDGPKDRIKATLDAFVKKGAITQAQEDSILQALKDAAPPAKPAPAKPSTPNIKAFIGDLTRATSTYLGLTPGDLLKQLRSGKSVADVAKGIPGKSGGELATLLTTTATGRIDQAVGAGKLTVEQAAALKPKITAEVSAFLQRSFTRPALPVKPTAPPTP